MWCVRILVANRIQTGKKMFSLYRVSNVRIGSLHPPSLPGKLVCVCVCVSPPETKNFNPDLSFFHFFIRIQRADPFCKLKSQLFISPFLGMSHRRCHQSPQDGHHYNDLLCQTENLRNDFPVSSIWN